MQLGKPAQHVGALVESRPAPVPVSAIGPLQRLFDLLVGSRRELLDQLAGRRVDGAVSRHALLASLLEHRSSSAWRTDPRPEVFRIGTPAPRRRRDIQEHVGQTRTETR